jgi:hypothetical protein
LKRFGFGGVSIDALDNPLKVGPIVSLDYLRVLSGSKGCMWVEVRKVTLCL